MESKIIEFIKQNQIILITWALFIKLMVSGLSLSDSLGALVLFVSLQAVRVLEHSFPKRPDLFKEMIDLTNEHKALKEKYESLESDVTALKFGMSRK